VAIGRDPARVGDGHASKQEDRPHIDRVRGVIGQDESLDGLGAVAGRDVMPQHVPSIAYEILLQPVQFGRQVRRVGIGDNEDNLPSILDERRFDSGADESLTVYSAAVLII